MKKRMIIGLILCFVLTFIIIISTQDTDAGVATLNITNQAKTIEAGKSFAIKLNGIKSRKVKWTSSKTSVATVSKNGIVKGCSKGNTIVIGKYKGIKFKIKVKVTARKERFDAETEWNLKDGYYTAGIDIPAGTFDVTPTAGIGFITCPSHSANLRGPEYSAKKYADYSGSFKNFTINKGEILEIKGVQIRINYSSVKSSVSPRVYDESLAVVLSAGDYKVGRDIKAGRYNVKFVSGSGGFVTSYRTKGECKINSNMDGDSKTGDYVDLVSNILLVKGETIHVTSGLTVSFIPEIQ